MDIDRIFKSLLAAPRAVLRSSLGVLAGALLLLAPGLSVGQNAAFDHVTTGWPLTGMHENVRCETCHIKGIFKGTPRTCSLCHSQNDTSRGATAMPVAHIVIGNQTCDSCHSTSTFLGVLFTHVMVVPGTCNTCHDGVHSSGKPAGHVPTTASCDACHRTTAFAPVVQFDHLAWSQNKGSWTCTNCHDGHFALGKPINHIPSPASTTCETCHFAPNTTTTFTSFAGGEMDHVNITANCGQCHAPAVAGSFVGVQIRSSTGLVPPHVPTTVTTCETCHQLPPPPMPIPVSGAASVGGTTFAGALMSHAGITNNCATCHGVNVMAGTFFGVVPKTQNGLSPLHIPTTGACEACHTNAIPSMLIPGSGATAGMTTFSGGQMSHAGITTGCAGCHGPTISGNSFFGISSIVVMPPVSPVGVSSHIPSSTTCETCHIGSAPAGLVPGNSTKTAPGTLFAAPVPTSAQIHTGVTAGCSACHDTNFVWMGVTSYPITRSAPFVGFQTRPQNTSGTFFVADGGHPTNGDCSSCHGGFTDFNGYSKPANHIPYAAAAQCTACHTTTDYSLLPTLTNIHANAQSTTGNCAQCHSPAAAASYAIPSANFAIVTTNSAGTKHIPLGSQDCSVCHVGANSSTTTPVIDGAVFSNSAMSHTGITNNCAACHGAGITAATFTGLAPMTSGGLSPAHMPTTVSCETCHGNAIPSMLIPASGAGAGMTTFAGGQMSHTGITTNCAACHGPSVTGSSFFGITNIVVMPQVSPVGVNSHIPSSTTCETCHLGTTPAGLIAGNAASSTVPGSKFATPAPTSAQIHTGVTGGCAACHETNFVWMGMTSYPITRAAPFTGFQTRPQATAGTFFVADGGHPTSGDCSSCHGGFTNFNGYSTPANHIPYAAAAACTACHTSTDYSVIPTVANIHANAQSTTTNCAQCHSPAAAATYAIPSASFSITTTNSAGVKHIPLGTQDCSLCHVGANSSTVTPVPNGAGFNNSATSHSGITNNCAACHGSTITASTFTGIAPMTYIGLSPSHLPTSAACELCHANAIPSMLIPVTGAGAGMTTFAGGQMSHTGVTSGCASCHGPTITATSFFGITKIVVMPAVTPVGVNSHIPSSTTCETCHLGTTPAGLIAGNAAATTVPGSKFATPVPTGAQIHTGVTSGCVACHETNYVWMGMGNYPIKPTTKIAGALYTGFNTRPGAAGTYSIADTGHPTSGDCSNCHNTTDFSGYSKPTNHIPYATAAACTACHTNTDYSVMPTLANIHANAQSTTANCAQCHSPANAATYAIPSASFSIVTTTTTGIKHMPLGTQDCSVCHVGANSSTLTPVPNGARFTNSATSHAGITTNCAACHGTAITASTFTGVAPKTYNGLSPKHVPTTAACELCHANAIPSMLIPVTGATTGMTTFANGQFSHSGITTGCVACHGPTITAASFFGITKIVVMPAVTPVGVNSHIPSSTTCETCHLGTTPAGVLPGNAASATPPAGTSKFFTPIPTTTQIHTGVTAGCAACHDTNNVWMDMTSYPISRTAPFTGFQTRPQATAGTFFVADAGHPTTGDCSACHGSFTDFAGTSKPANHIPYAAAAQCTACHTNTNFAVFPTVASIHANAQSTTANCNQCHSPTAAATYAIPSVNFTIKSTNSTGVKHIPLASQDCSLCHVGAGTGTPTLPVTNTSLFSSSKMSHTGITNNCATCHGPTITATSFTGITRIIVMPKTSPMGVTSHIPSSTVCETCHLGSTPAGLILANAASATLPGSLFATPVPSTTQIHTGVSGGCSSCHETSYVWMGMTRYPISPTTTVGGTANTQYIGFQTRPVSAASTFSVADANHPTSGDCSNCHTGTTYFSGAAKPNGHIPTNQACAVCHVVAGNFSVTGLTTNFTTLHTGISSGCISCHTAGTGAGPFAGCATPTACSTPPPLTYQPKVMPLAPGGSPTAPSTLTHVPAAGIACEKCHSPTVFTAFSGMQMKGNTPAHTAVAAYTCITCHEGTPKYVWYGVTIRTEPVGHEGRKAGQDCAGSGCHSKTKFSSFMEIRVRPMVRAAIGSVGVGPRVLPDGTVLGSAPIARTPFNHQGVLPGQCATCHNGQTARGLPAKHITTRASCDTCHRNTSWLPAAFNHAGISVGTCASCHDGQHGPGKPSGHFVTVRSCDACHRKETWVPVSYSHLSPAYQPRPDALTCVSCHVTNGEIVPRQMRVRPRNLPLPQ